MFLLRQPSKGAIQSLLESQRDQAFSYPEAGASRHGAPAGYNVDHNRVQLGHGHEAYINAIKAIQCWKMFEIGWCHLYWPDAPIEVGVTVAVVIKHFGFWSLNACRIVYVIEEDSPIQRYGFAYGTLPEHGEIGEERFIVEWNRSDDSVWYDLFAFSRPNHVLAKLGYLLSRMLQKRFARDSKKAMVKAVSESCRRQLAARLSVEQKFSLRSHIVSSIFNEEEEETQ